MKILFISSENNTNKLKRKLKSFAGITIDISDTIPSNLSTYNQVIVDSQTPIKLRNMISPLIRSHFYPTKKLNDEHLTNRSILEFTKYINKDESIHTKTYEFFNETALPTEYGDFIMFGFKGRIHGREVVGLRTKNLSSEPYVRIHSMCHTGDIFSSLKCDCGSELKSAIELIAKTKDGILIYTPEEGRDIGVLNKINVYKSQSEGYDTVDAQYINYHPNDLRNYDYIKDILKHYRISKVKLITNNPEKVFQFELSGLVVKNVIKLASPVNPHNRSYLQTKMLKNGHDFSIEFPSSELD